MSIVLTTADAVDVPAGAGGRMLKRVNSGSGGGIPAAGQLLIAGPATGEANLVSEPFVISTNGALAGSITVSLSFTGVSNTPSATSVVLSPSSPTATVDVTPAAIGALTVTATAPGLTSASVTYELTSIAPDPDLDQWAYKSDPELAWGSTHGTNYLGQTLRPVCQLEFDSSPLSADTTIRNYVLTNAIGTYDGSAGAPSYGATMTTTQIQKGAVTPTFPVVQRVADPAGGGFTCFKMTLDGTEHYGGPSKWRAQIVPSGAAEQHPWGTVLWSVMAAYMTEDMVLQNTAGAPWMLFNSLNQGASSLIRGGGFHLGVDGGNGDASAAALTYEIEHYENPNWLAGDYTNATAYIKKKRSARFMTPTIGTWVYFITQHCVGCGYSDPTHGAIYGTVGSFSGGSDDGNAYFLRMWYAVDDGYPITAFPEYRGHWAGPHNPAHTAAAENSVVEGVLTNTVDLSYTISLYGLTDGQPSTMPTADPNQRTIYHRGVKVWKHQHGMDQIKVLAAFRGT